MRKQTKQSREAPSATREPNDSDLRAIERAEEKLRALENDEGDEASAPVASAMTTTHAASASVNLAHLGLDRLAYVRRAVIDDVPVWSIYSAAGLPIGAAPTLEQAWGAI